MEYLPQQMSETEIESLARKAVDASGAKTTKEIGKVMNILMPQLKGRADGKVVSKVVSKLLN